MGIRVKNYFESIFTECDLIVIDGAGLLEYSYNEYQEYLYSLIETAQENNIPVVCNAIGCAGEFNKDDYRCKLLIKAFHSPCIMYVSARDSRESVQECVGTRLNVKLLADAAFVVDEAFNVKAQSKHCIGIGLIRGNATLSYSKGFDENDWINLYYDIAKELTKQGFSYEFFTNGSECDYRTGLKVIEKLGESRDKLVDRPHKPETLLKTIASYDGIITCRMHSSIAAFSLRIPSVILSWNNKVDKYMEQVGYPKRAIKQDLFEASYIVYQLKNAMQEGISESNYNRMKSLARESVKDFISLI